MCALFVIASVPPSTTSKTVNKIKKFTQKVEKKSVSQPHAHVWIKHYIALVYWGHLSKNNRGVTKPLGPNYSLLHCVSSSMYT